MHVASGTKQGLVRKQTRVSNLNSRYAICFKEKMIDQGKDELSMAFKMIQKMDLDVVVEKTEECVQCVFSTGWRVVSHWELPHWLRDNDFLWHMHRPQLPSFKECFCSMFR